MRPEKAHTENTAYFICNSYRKFYFSKCVAIYVYELFIWKPKLLLGLIPLVFERKENSILKLN